jgi:anti-anti-sigma regulatory factor
MLKISVAESDKHSRTLRLEGQLSGPWVEELRHACEGILNDGLSLKLDLSEITFLDHQGALLLVGLKARRATLSGSSPFVSEQLRHARNESPGVCSKPDAVNVT